MASKKYTKPALTIPQQIEFLISQGLRIDDRDLAAQALSAISYYRLSSLFDLFQRNEHFSGIEMGYASNWRLDPFWGK